MDAADVASEEQDLQLQTQLLAHRRAAALDEPGTDLCADCRDPIPVERRRALPSAVRCITCQGFFERAVKLRKIA